MFLHHNDNDNVIAFLRFKTDFQKPLELNLEKSSIKIMYQFSCGTIRFENHR